MDVDIRDAQDGDNGVIAHLLGELGYTDYPDLASRKINILSEKTNDRVLIATINSEVVGFASLHIFPLLHKEGNVCTVTSIVVGKKWRGKGIGQRLIESCETIAWSKGCKWVEVTSGEPRMDAQSFYQKIGYNEVSRRFVKSI